MKKPEIEVCLTPRLFPLFEMQDKTAVIIDILRATSTICAILRNGAEAVIPVVTMEACKSYGSGYLLAAERGGEKPAGFTYGNSPFDFMEKDVAGKTVVLTTSNGTKAISMARAEAAAVVAGAFLNISALCSWLLHNKGPVVLFCAGWKDQFNLEDTLFAGAMLARLDGHFQPKGDAAVMARHLFQQARNDLFGFLKRSSHYQRLAKLGLERDIRYCLQSDQCEVAPILEGDRLVAAADVPHLSNSEKWAGRKT